MSSDSDSDAPSTSKKVKTSHRKQKFRQAWVDLPEYKAWLRSVPTNELKGQCLWCKNEFVAELTIIKKHANSQKHKANAKIKTTTKTSMFDQFVKKKSSSPGQDEVKEAEILLCGFLAEHNISFLSMDHLCPLLGRAFPDSKIAKEMSLRRTKTKNIITNVIAKSHKAEMIKILQVSKFSILVDESTDISVTKMACIVVRFYSEKNKKIETLLWKMIPIFSDKNDIRTQGTAEHLYDVIIDTFVKKDIPLTNIVGFASDGCNVMMGEHNSVASRFRDKCPGIVVLKCICHSLHICSSQACKKLPRTCEDLARNIYNFFKISSKRQSEFRQFQHFAQVEVHKLLHPSQTRWLSLGQVVKRLLEQWSALQLFFNEKYLEERLLAAEQIYNGLNDPFVKLYFKFLNYVLPKINELNLLFQSDKVIITNLHGSLAEKYSELLLCFLNNRYVYSTPLHDIDFEDNSNFLPNTNLYLGVDIMNEVKKREIQHNKDALNYFYESCKNFFKVLCSEIQKRFDFEDPILSELSIFNPKNAISNEVHDKCATLFPLFQNLERFHEIEHRQKIDDQWRNLPNYSFPNDTFNLNDDIDDFWRKLLEFKNENGSLVFEDLARFVLNILSLPHSNAACERIFSEANAIKTKSRNKLITTTLNGTLLSKQFVRISGNCTNFTPNRDMLSRMTTAQLYPKSKEAPSTSTSGVNAGNVESDDDEIIFDT